jgi:hypothetical protein
MATKEIVAVRLDAADEATGWAEGHPDFAGQVVFEIEEETSGTYTLTFQARVGGNNPGDGSGNVYSIQAQKVADRTWTTTHTSGSALYRVDAAGLQVRVKMTAWTSGAVDVHRASVIG